MALWDLYGAGLTPLFPPHHPKSQHELRGHRDCVHCVALRDPPQCLSGGEDGTVRLWGEWDPQSGPKWPQSGPKWPQSGPKWPQLALNGPKSDLSGPKWS